MEFKELISQFIEELDRQLTNDEYKMINIAYAQGKQDEFEEIINLLRSPNE